MVTPLTRNTRSVGLVPHHIPCIIPGTLSPTRIPTSHTELLLHLFLGRYLRWCIYSPVLDRNLSRSGPKILRWQWLRSSKGSLYRALWQRGWLGAWQTRAYIGWGIDFDKYIRKAWSSGSVDRLCAAKSRGFWVVGHHPCYWFLLTSWTLDDRFIWIWIEFKHVYLLHCDSER